MNSQRIAITGESMINLKPEEFKELDIKYVNFHVLVNGIDKIDEEVPVEKCFEYTDRTGKMCTTSAANVLQYKEMFDEVLKDYDYIIHFSLTTGISSGYNNAVIAADGRKNIFCINSHGTSGQIVTQARYARKLIDAGYPFEIICQKILERRPYASCSFNIDTLHYLYKGGRCTALASLGANVLKIKPEIWCDESQDGKFIVGKKHRGSTRKCLIEYTRNQLENRKDTLDKDFIFVTYSYMEDMTILDDVVGVIKEYGFKNIMINKASPVNGYHSGPNVVGIHYYFDGDHKVVPYER